MGGNEGMAGGSTSPSFPGEGSAPDDDEGPQAPF
jgi:hypothetical protein